MDGQNLGMSRAAQKKRKRQQKINTKTQLSEMHLPAVTTASSSEEADSDNGQQSITKKVRVVDTRIANSGNKRGWKMFDRSTIDHPLLAEIASMPISKILQLRDVYEALATEKAALIMSKITHPQSRDSFYESIWDKSPAHFSRTALDNSSYFGKFFTKKAFKTLVTEHVLALGKDVNIVDNEGLTLPSQIDEGEENGDTSAQLINMNGADVWSKHNKQNAITLLQPQLYNDNIWNLCSSLEHEFGCRVDVNITLQPSKHRLSTPTHINTHEFILQLEGQTKWTLTKEQHSGENTEGASSSSTDVERVYEMNSGDALYIPNGWTVVEEALEGDVSLFLSLRTSNSNTVSSLFKLTVSQAIENLHVENRLFRKLLPPDVRGYLGVAVSENEEDPKRQALMSDLTNLMNLIVAQSLEIIDPAHDQLSKQFIVERLPPCLTEEEETKTAARFPDAPIYPYTQLRAVRPGIAIAVVEDGRVVVYHAMDNSRELFGNPVSPLEFELDDGPAIEALLNAYPQPVVVSELEHPSEDVEDKTGVAQALYKEGILMIVDEASKPVVDDSDDNSDSPF